MPGAFGTTQAAAGPSPYAVAGSVDRSGAVLALGGLLVAVDFATVQGGGQLVSYLFGGRDSYGYSAAYLPFELVALAALWGLSKTGDEGGTLALSVVIALWVLWVVRRFGGMPTATIGGIFSGGLSGAQSGAQGNGGGAGAHPTSH